MILEDNFVKFKNMCEIDEKVYKKSLVEEYKLTEKNIGDLLKLDSYRKKIIFGKSQKESIFETDDKHKIHSIGFCEGLCKGAEMQLENTIDKIMRDYMMQHIKENDIDHIDYSDFTIKLENFVHYRKINVDILIFDYDINYLALGENLYAEHEEDYYLLIQKDSTDKEFDITYIDNNKIIESYKLDEQDKKMLLEKYDLKID